MGLDLGIKALCITSEGEKYENPKTVRKCERKLGKLQRQLAHKEKGSSNYYKQRKEIALCHEKGNGYVLIVEQDMTGISMLQKIYWYKD